MVEQRRVERAWPWQHDEDRITMVDLCRACSGLDTEVRVLLIFLLQWRWTPVALPQNGLSWHSPVVWVCSLAFELWPYLIGPSCLGQI
jgi:hypothetical protein